MSVAARLLRTGTLTIGWLFVAASFILSWSVLVPVVPWLRIYAVSVVPNAAPWYLLGGVAALIVAILFDNRRTTAVTRPLRAGAATVVLTAAGIIGHFLSIAYANDVPIRIARTLSLRHFSDTGAPDESHIYAAPAGEPLWLDIYRPAPARRPARMPVMMIVHGGGFVGGDRRIGAANMRHYASQGWTVVSIDYRLARPGRPTWNLAVEDVRCALGWVARNADALNVDIRRLTLSGVSAGGHLAMAAAYGLGPDRGATACGMPVPRPAALWVRAPLIDPRNSWDNPGELQPVQRHYMTMYLGGSPERYPDRYAALDLRRHVDRRNPPTLILAGRDDPLLPVADVEAFTRRSRATGATVRLILFPYSGHDFNTTYGGISNQIVVGAVQQFSQAHGGGPETHDAMRGEQLAGR